MTVQKHASQTWSRKFPVFDRVEQALFRWLRRTLHNWCPVAIRLTGRSCCATWWHSEVALERCLQILLLGPWQLQHQIFFVKSSAVAPNQSSLGKLIFVIAYDWCIHCILVLFWSYHIDWVIPIELKYNWIHLYRSVFDSVLFCCGESTSTLLHNKEYTRAFGTADAQLWVRTLSCWVTVSRRLTIKGPAGLMTRTGSHKLNAHGIIIAQDIISCACHWWLSLTDLLTSFMTHWAVVTSANCTHCSGIQSAPVMQIQISSSSLLSQRLACRTMLWQLYTWFWQWTGLTVLLFAKGPGQLACHELLIKK